MKEEETKEEKEKQEVNRVWTDGSATGSNHPGARRAGWGVYYDNGQTSNGAMQGSNQTVYKAELRAVVEAVERRLAVLERAELTRESLERFSAVVITTSDA